MDTPSLQLGRWPVTIELPVQWGDMDALGHVNNVVYLRWFESGRIAYFERAGLWEKLPAGIGPILARTTIDYRLPLEFPDAVRVACTVTRLGTTSVTTALQVRSRKHGRAIAAEGEAVLVMVDYSTGAKQPLWEELRRRILELEASAPEPGAVEADA